MAQPEPTPLEQAIAALRAGERHKARELLTRLLRTEQKDVEAWLWMSAAVDTEKEQIFCLQRALKADPSSVEARRGLVVLGALSPEEAALPAADGLETFRIKAPRLEQGGPPRRGWLYALGGVAAIGVVVGLVFLLMQLFGPRKPNYVVVTSVPTTPAPTRTTTLTVLAGKVGCTPPEVISVATPLAAYLCVTTTPTANPISKEKSTREEFTVVQNDYFAGDWAGVINGAADAIKVVPDSAHLYFYIGEAYRHSSGKLSLAAQNYSTAISKDANYAPAYWGRALASPANALDDFNKAVKADPAFVPAYLGLAQTYSGNGNLPQTINTLQKAKSLAPDNAEVVAFLALAYVDSDQPLDALKMVSETFKLDAAQPVAWFARGRAEYALGQFEDADRDLSLSYQYVLALDVLYADLFKANVLSADGLAKAAVDDDARALVAFTDALAARPASPPLGIYVARGQLYLRQKDYDSAGADFNKVITALKDSDDPLLADAYLGNGLAWLGRDKPDSALSNFQMVIRLVPDVFDGYFYLGQAQFENGQPDEAVTSLSLALGKAQTDDQKAQAYALRAQVFQTLGLPLQQVADLQALLKLKQAPTGAAATAQALLTQIGPLPTATATATSTPTLTASPTAGPSPTRTPKPSATRRVTATRTPTVTRTPVVPTPLSGAQAAATRTPVVPTATRTLVAPASATSSPTSAVALTPTPTSTQP